eukprot:c32734_g1_i1 orf=43-261(+)
MWMEKISMEGVVKVRIDQDHLTLINEWYERHCLIMQFVGRMPPDSSLQSWIWGQWIRRGIEVENVQYLARGQ